MRHWRIDMPVRARKAMRNSTCEPKPQKSAMAPTRGEIGRRQAFAGFPPDDLDRLEDMRVAAPAPAGRFVAQHAQRAERTDAAIRRAGRVCEELRRQIARELEVKLDGRYARDGRSAAGVAPSVGADKREFAGDGASGRAGRADHVLRRIVVGGEDGATWRKPGDPLREASAAAHEIVVDAARAHGDGRKHGASRSGRSAQRPERFDPLRAPSLHSMARHAGEARRQSGGKLAERGLGHGRVVAEDGSLASARRGVRRIEKHDREVFRAERPRAPAYERSFRDDANRPEPRREPPHGGWPALRRRHRIDGPVARQGEAAYPGEFPPVLLLAVAEPQIQDVRLVVHSGSVPAVQTHCILAKARLPDKLHFRIGAPVRGPALACAP